MAVQTFGVTFLIVDVAATSSAGVSRTLDKETDDGKCYSKSLLCLTSTHKPGERSVSCQRKRQHKTGGIRNRTNKPMICTNHDPEPPLGFTAELRVRLPKDVAQVQRTKRFNSQQDQRNIS